MSRAKAKTTKGPEARAIRSTIVKASIGVVTFLMIGGMGVAWTMYQGATKAEKNSELLSCENLIRHNVNQANTHWLLCLDAGQKPWNCRVIR